MRDRFAIRLLLLFTAFVMLVQDVHAQDRSDEPSEQLRRRLEVAAGADDVVVGDERIHAGESVARFYEGREYSLAWTERGRPARRVDSLVGEIRRSAREGMRPGDYHLHLLERTLDRIDDARRDGERPPAGLLVDLDLLCTDAFLLQAAHRLAGRVNPETIDREWIANRRNRDLVALLENAISGDSIPSALGELLPPYPEYARLQSFLKRYRQIEYDGGWPAKDIEYRRPTALRSRSMDGSIGRRVRFRNGTDWTSTGWSARQRCGH